MLDEEGSVAFQAEEACAVQGLGKNDTFGDLHQNEH